VDLSYDQKSSVLFLRIQWSDVMRLDLAAGYDNDNDSDDDELLNMHVLRVATVILHQFVRFFSDLIRNLT